MARWQYVGDMDPECGGTWFDVSQPEQFVELVTIVEGFEVGQSGCAIVVQDSVQLPKADDPDFEGVLDLVGTSPEDLEAMEPDERVKELAWAKFCNDGVNMDGPSRVVRFDGAEPTGNEDFVCDAETDLKAYVNTTFLGLSADAPLPGRQSVESDESARHSMGPA